MSDYFVGEIRLFAGRYPPANWHLCDGTLLPITGYEALYSLIGTTYGGNGSSNFALPDLRGRVPVGQGTGAGLTARIIGQSGGSEAVALQTAHTGAHSHTMLTAGMPATTTTVGNTVMFANTASPTVQYLKNGLGSAGGNAVNPAASTISSQGSGAAHSNIMPTAILTYIIALNGTYPMRP
jgi:microcystin-dependent protein